MNAECLFPIQCVAVGLLLFVGAGCDQPTPSGSLVLTQAPVSAALPPDADVLEARYPIGSRVVLRETPFDARHERVLSGSLVAAGSPVVSYDGKRVFFVGKTGAGRDWQIYETVLAGWGPRVLTSMPGGAMSPTLLPNGSLVFISPVPKTDSAKASRRLPALFAQSPGGQPRQLTFNSSPVLDSTVLSDGRILYVAMHSSSSNWAPESMLYTINNDGTEVAAFAEPLSPVSLMKRPRQTSDGRVALVVSKAGSGSPDGLAESIRMARPCQDGSPLLSNVTARVLSVQPAGDDEFLACAGLPGNSTLPAVFRLRESATTLGSPLVADPKWGFLEAVEVSAHPPPMGRLSTLDFTKRTGKVLCLDVSFTRDTSDRDLPAPAATSVRVTAEILPGVVRPLGEVPVQADGSFLVEVPADVPLGFEMLGESGRTLRRQRPSMWVRPGENRSCVGCHEPPHRAPHNHRPLAVNAPVPCLSLEPEKLAKAESEK
jgi:hypothetical protein